MIVQAVASESGTDIVLVAAVAIVFSNAVINIQPLYILDVRQIYVSNTVLNIQSWAVALPSFAPAQVGYIALLVGTTVALS